MKETDIRSAESLHRLLERRKRSVNAVLTGVILFVFVLNGIDWYVYFMLGDFMEERLGKQLESVCTTFTDMIDRNILTDLKNDTGNDFDILKLENVLDKIKNDNNLDAIFIFDENLRSLMDTRSGFGRGDVYAYLTADSAAINYAWLKGSSSSNLHKTGNQYFKSGFASISDETGNPIAIVCADADADFLSGLASARKAMYLFGIVSIMVIISAVTTLRKSIKALVGAQEAVAESEKFAVIGAMSAGIAHEIRNPLGIIRSTADIIRRKYGLEDDEIFEFIPSEVDRVNDLVEGFLSLARERVPEPEAVDAGKWMKDVVARLMPLCSEKGAEITLNLPEKKVVLFIDPDISEQVLRNLVMNALEAGGEAGTDSILITITAGQTKKRVPGGKGDVSPGLNTESGIRFAGYFPLYVEDNGPGIPEEIRKTMFEPFVTTRKAGTGLGLAIAKSAMESQGGILVPGRSGNGTTFICWFPVVELL